MKKKFLSILLALAMCLTLLPATALAEGETAIYIDDNGVLKKGSADWTTTLLLPPSYTVLKLDAGSYKLTSDVTIESTIQVTGTVTLDLNGYVLKLDSAVYSGEASGSVIEVNTTGNLTLKDSNTSAKHYFYAQSGSDLWRWDASAESAVTQPTDGDGKTYHTVKGGVITGGSWGNGGGILVAGGGNSNIKAVLTMEGGSIIGCTSNYGGGVYVGDENAEFTMKSGAVIAGCAASFEGGGVAVRGSTTFTMEGGKIHDCLVPRLASNNYGRGGGVSNLGTFTMSGGSIENCRVYTKDTTACGETIAQGGGGVYSAGNFTMTGGKIVGCATAEGLGDGILLSEGKTLGDIVNNHSYTLKTADGWANLNSNYCGNVTYGCPHTTVGTDGKCTDCHTQFIAEVTSTTEDGTAISYLADTGVDKGETESDVDDNFDLIEDAFANSATTKVKLLANVEATGNVATIGFAYPNQTLDLNGYTLDTKGGRISFASGGSNAPSLTITDSSTDKTGVLKAAEVKVAVGSLTINGGTLLVQNSNDVPPILIEGGSMTISGTAKVNCATITVAGSGSGSSITPARLTVQGTAEITGGITVSTNGTLTMTGGKVQIQPSADIPPAYSAIVDVTSGTANISGGSIETLLIESTGTAKISGGSINYLMASTGTTELSGGTYGLVQAHNGSATALLKNGYAYYAKASAEDTNYTKLTAPTAPEEASDDSLVYYVAVKSHECSFSLNEDTGDYRCDCGRTATQEPIAYVDEDDNTAYCTEYRTITASETVDTAQNFWYVVTGDEPFEVENLNFPQGAHLILKNNTALTVKGRLFAESGKSLSIYGQPAVTGETTGKLVVGTTNYTTGAICSKGNLTINGGDIAVNASAHLYYSDGFDNGLYSVAAADKLTVNGGSLTVNVPGLTNASSNGVFGVYAGELTVNGGEITVISSPITAKNGQVSSCGIFTHKLTMTGGEVSATGAAITATYTYDPDDICVASSTGISVETVWQDGGDTVPGTGAVSITGGELTAKGGDVTASGSVPFMSTWSEGLYASELSVANATVEATGGNASLTANQPEGQDVTVRSMASSYGISAEMTVKSGSITAKSGTAAATGSDKAEAEAWDLDRSLTMQGGTVTDGTAAGSVLVDLDLTMTGGTMKLKENSLLGNARASGTAKLADLLPEGYAYYEEGYEPGSGSFVNLSNGLTEVYFVYVRLCTYTAESGTCPYCGENFGPAAPDPDPDPTPSTPSGGSSGSSAPTYTVTAPKTDNGSVSVSPKNAKKGASVTITVTPDEGYTLETLTVLDRNGNEIELTDNGDGTYSFKMPAGKVEIQATFAEDNSVLSFFTDVTADSYYYDAVLWAAKNGITGGIDENHFGPGLSCTRAQLVTFLWRAAGCPVVNSAMDFSDVGDGYYTEAIRWAASLGIVGGYGNGLFGSDDTITREQFVTILYRFAKNAGMDVSIGESTNILSYGDALDVSEYAVEAFQWATGAGIVQGNNGNLMPGQPCTRAQIVTMLYRLLGK